MAKITAAQVKELREMTGVGMMDAKNALVETEGNMDDAVQLLREKGLAASAKKAGRIAAEGVTATYVDGNVAAVIEINAETDFVAKNDKFQDLVRKTVKAIVANKPANMDEANEIDLGGQTIAEAVNDATNIIGEKISFRRFELFEKTDDDVFGDYLHMGGRIGVLTLIENSSNKEIADDVAMHVAAINPRYVSRDKVPEDVIEKERAIQTEIALNEGKPANIVEKMIGGRMNKFLAEISLTEQDFVKNPDVTVGKYVEADGGKIAKFVRFEVGEGMERRDEDFAAEVAAQMKN